MVERDSGNRNPRPAVRSVVDDPMREYAGGPGADRFVELVVDRDDHVPDGTTGGLDVGGGPSAPEPPAPAGGGPNGGDGEE